MTEAQPLPEDPSPPSPEDKKALQQLAHDIFGAFTAGQDRKAIVDQLVEQNIPRDKADELVGEVETQWQEWAASEEGQEAIARMRDDMAEMKPIKDAPSLMTMNGIGTIVIGSRDKWDDGSYIKTHCFCVLFVPIFSLGAYRVMDSPNGGWYFLAQVPLSKFARSWNYLFASLIVYGIGLGFWKSYQNSPGQVAKRKPGGSPATGRSGARRSSRFPSSPRSPPAARICAAQDSKGCDKFSRARSRNFRLLMRRW